MSDQASTNKIEYRNFVHSLHAHKAVYIYKLKTNKNDLTVLEGKRNPVRNT